MPAAPSEAERTHADADPGSAAVPKPKAPLHHPQQGITPRPLTSVLTAAASCAGSAASPQGEDRHDGTPDSQHARHDVPARAPGRGAPIDAGGGWVPGGIPDGAAGTGCRARPHTRAALLRLWRFAGVRGPGLLPGRSCSPG